MFTKEFTPTERKVLEIMFSDPSGHHSLSHLQKKSKVSYMSIFRAIRNMEKRNLVTTISISGKKFRRLNPENPQSLKVFELLEVNKRLELKKKNITVWKIVNELVERSVDELKQDLYMVILFGSAARGELRNGSDIDLLVVVSGPKDMTEAKIKKALSGIYSYGREVVPIVISPAEFIDGIKEGKDFFKTLWEDRVIFYGESIFWREVVKWKQ